MSRNAIWLSIGHDLCECTVGIEAASSGIFCDPDGSLLINLDHFLASRIYVPSGCCHLVESSACLLYLHDKGRAVYTHAYQPGQPQLREQFVFQSACGATFADLGHEWPEFFFSVMSLTVCVLCFAGVFRPGETQRKEKKNQIKLGSRQGNMNQGPHG